VKTLTPLYQRFTRIIIIMLLVMQSPTIFSQSNDRDIESGGTISSSETLCYGTIPDGIRNISSPSGEIEGFLVIQWEKKTETGSWETIPGATLLEYYPGPISETTHYRRACRESVHQPWTYSNVITKNVVPAIEDVSVTVSDIECKGAKTGEAVANVSGGTPGYIFNWSNDDTGPVADDLIAGTYALEVTDANNCSFTKTDIVVNEPEQSVEITESFAVHPSCPSFNDGIVFVMADFGEPPYEFEWSNGMTGPNLFGVPGGTYHVTVKDAKGCENTLENIEVISPDTFKTKISVQPVSCFGNEDGIASLQSIGGTPPYDFVWEDGSTGFNQSGLEAGEHHVSIRDNNGCLYNETIEISEPSPLEVGPHVVNNKLCNASVNMIPAGGTAPYDFIWDDNITNEGYRTNLCPGEYTATITDKNGCEMTETVAILPVIENQEIEIELVSNPYVETEGIRITIPTIEFVQVHVYSASGQLIEVIEQQLEDDNLQIWLDIDKYANGMYIFDVVAGQYRKSTKLTFF
jgi:hypothetical protein